MRDAANITEGYNFEKMKAGLEKEGGQFTVFGGEALLTPLPVLEEIFAYGFKRFGANGVQTNGALISSAHIALFKKYQVHVGLSLDGPEELNDSRWAGSLEKTRAATAASFAALEELFTAGITPSLIVTLYRGNAGTTERLSRLLKWFYSLEARGVRSVRLHLLEVENESVRESMALTIQENTAALLRLYEFQATTRIKFDLFAEMAKLLLGDDKGATCTWNACDPYTTNAVRGVDGLGQSSNCGRTNKEGIDWRKSNQVGYERQLALYHTPQADLGCQDCRFFFACKGQCPGTAEDNDWRNRSEHCAIWMSLFERIENDLVGLGRTPLSLAGELRRKVEVAMLDTWSRGRNISVREALSCARTGVPPVGNNGNREHGDHWDAPDGYEHNDGPTQVHGDNGTTTMHGDSNAS